MNFGYISAEDWKEFQEKHPRAYSFLQSAVNRGEEASLRAELERKPEYRRKAWIESRLADFDMIRAAFWGLDAQEVRL